MGIRCSFKDGLCIMMISSHSSQFITVLLYENLTTELKCMKDKKKSRSDP